MALRIFWESLLVLSWLVALNWAWRVLIALRKLPGVPDLLDPVYDPVPWAVPAAVPDSLTSSISTAIPQTALSQAATVSKICVIVPACNEEAAIGAALRSLLATSGVRIEIIAVDDRSTDATGAIMDSLAASVPEDISRPLLRVIHVEQLPEGWLGKPHAMAIAAGQTNAEWLLFTDGDVIFRPDALRRAMQLVESLACDHLVLQPTVTLRLFGERMMMSAIGLLSIWILRPWKIPDPKARRDSLGIGAFNMVRREVYSAVGGYEGLRMDILEDLRLGYEIKRAGYQQRVVYGRGLISVRWAVGARGVVRNMTKNAFALFGFRAGKVLASCFGLLVMSLLPFAAPLLSFAARGRSPGLSPIYWGPAALLLAVLWLMARDARRNSEVSPAYVVTFPIGVCIFIFAILRSMLITLRDGGVTWRGTLYSLSELREHGGRFR